MIVKAILPSRENAIDAPENKGLRPLFLAASAFLPLIFFFNLFNRNQEFLPFVFSLLVAGFFALVSLAAYLFFAWITKTRLVLFTVVLPAWVIFYAYPSIHRLLNFDGLLRWAKPLVLTGLLYGCFLLLSLLLRRIRAKEVYALLSFVIVAMFAINFLPAMYRGIGSKREKYALLDGQTIRSLGIKRDFFVDDNVPRPNIYWFHPDGRMNTAAVEKYFGDGQSALKTELSSRGFLLNEDAYLDAGGTVLAVPALMCPSYYDTSLCADMENPGLFAGLPRSKRKAVRDTLGGGRDAVDFARQNNELFHAFFAAGYEVNTIAMQEIFIYPVDRFYYTKPGRYGQLGPRTLWIQGESIKTAALAELLNEATMVPYLIFSPEGKPFDFAEDRKLAVRRADLYPWDANVQRALLEVLGRDMSPRFVFIHDFILHAPFRMDENGDPLPEETYDIGAYLPNEKFADKVLLEMVDFVLEADPDAIIILQSDHGIHRQPSEDNMRALGYCDAEIVEMQNGVFSAVRIPEKWGGMPEDLSPIDPRNISRLLINRYVGENYAYLRN